jgi:hypothetical protein
MTVAGLWQNWDPAANNMTLVSNNVWEGLFFISATPTNSFKFAANGSWALNWGETNQTQTADPISGTGELNAGDIRHTYVRDGFYRFRFDDSTKAYSVDLVGYEYQGTGGNLVRNGAFEMPGTSDTEANQWQSLPHYRYGSRWGDTSRRDWRFYSPNYEAVVGTGQSSGGWWQESPAGVGFDYEASAWLWADAAAPFGPWTARVTQLKLEFYSPTYTRLGEVFTNIAGVADSWQQYSIRGAAPNNTAWARVVVNVEGAGQKGSLQLDDVEMSTSAGRIQGFDLWGFAANVGTHARGGWLAKTAQVSAVSVAGNGLALKPGASSIQTPDLEGGVGRVSFSYRNASEETEGPSSPCAFAVDASPDGSSWAQITAVIGISEQSFVPFSYALNDPAQRYVRIRNTGGTNDLLLDNINVDFPYTVSPYQDFSGWPGNPTTNSCYEFGEWKICTGRLFSAGAYQSPSLLLPGAQTGPYNYLRSPFFAEGYGEVSFMAARGTNGIASARLLIEESPDGSNWTAVATNENISGDWIACYQPLYQPQGRYLRFVNASGPTAGGETLLLQEGFSGGVTPPPDWTFTGITETYSSSGNYGAQPPSLKFDTTGDTVLTPTLSNPTSLTFFAKGNSMTGASFLSVQAYVTGTWVTVTNVGPLANSAASVVASITNTTTQLRFVYTKQAGNIAFDDLRVFALPGSPQPAQDLLLDNVVSGPPVEYREQNFDSWPTKIGYGDGVSSHQRWAITNAIVSSERSCDGQSVRLNQASGSYVQSPFFADGVGTISFDYRSWTTTAATVQLQTSTNGTTWTTLTNITTASAICQRFEGWFYITNGVSVRFYHPDASERILLDNISIGRPQPPADCSISGYIVPGAPYTNDAVTLGATVVPSYGARVVAVTGYYRVGESGAFSNLLMQTVDGITYASVTSIPPQTVGTLVQYYMRVDFTGPGAALSSPRFYPAAGSGAPASYRIPRAPPGAVWINEVKYYDWFQTSEFIELAGPTGFAISGWAIEIYTGTTNAFALPVSRYDIPDNTILPQDTEGLGFWVLGQPDVPNIDMTLTNALSAFLPIGIKLLNEAGGVEQALCFDATIPQFTRVVPVDDLFTEETTVALVGAGTNYSGFVWDDEVPRSPGGMNTGQWYGDAPPPAPDTWIARMTMGTNVTLVVVGNTNGWSVAPYYAGAMANSATWQPVTPFNSSASGSTNTIWFARPAATNQFYRVLLSSP